MFYSVITWLVAVGLASTFLFVFYAYLKARSLSNGFMAFASGEFHDATTSLLETPDELPDSVLDLLSDMNRLAQSRHASIGLLRAISTKNNVGEARRVRHSQQFEREIEAMRPELKELFQRAVVGWLNYVSHKNVVTNLRMAFAVMRLRSQGMDASKAEQEVGFRYLDGLIRKAC